MAEGERELCLILLSAMVGQIGARQAKEQDPKQHVPQTDHNVGRGGELRGKGVMHIWIIE